MAAQLARNQGGVEIQHRFCVQYAALILLTKPGRNYSNESTGECVLSWIQNTAAVIATISIVSSGAYAFAYWQAKSDGRATEIDKYVKEIDSKNSSLKKEIAEIRGLLSESFERLKSLENAKSSRVSGGSAPSAEEVAAVLVEKHLDVIRGPKGDTGESGPKGEKGETGPAGVNGEGGKVLPLASNAMVQVDFAQISSGIRLDGIEWGTPVCKRSGSAVKCEALIKNDSGEDDTGYSIQMSDYTNQTRAFTDALTDNKILKLSSKNWSKSYDRSVEFKFPAGIIYPLNWEIEGVPLEAKGFTRMDIRTEDGLVKYENIPIN